mmetsp:Transcript_32675/g.55620  ORF Transcript_32675/g.55620 Transcript_32675/m.55620 type:complete len:439 (+) Transcript_32675:177-1493(+)
MATDASCKSDGNNMAGPPTPATRTNDNRPRVNHTYHDFSRYLEEVGTPPKRKKADKNFPAKLHRILATPEFSQIITWMPHGRSWKILSKKMFMSTVVPKYFGQTAFQSFTRQLNGWGFKRLHQSGADYGGYYHECFLRGLPHLARLMTRQSNKGKSLPDAEGEPDFYEISRLFPLAPLPGMCSINTNTSTTHYDTAAAATLTFPSTTSNNLSYAPMHWDRNSEERTDLAGEGTSTRSTSMAMVNPLCTSHGHCNGRFSSVTSLEGTPKNPNTPFYGTMQLTPIQNQFEPTAYAQSNSSIDLAGGTSAASSVPSKKHLRYSEPALEVATSMSSPPSFGMAHPSSYNVNQNAMMPQAYASSWTNLPTSLAVESPPSPPRKKRRLSSRLGVAAVAPPMPNTPSYGMVHWSNVQHQSYPTSVPAEPLSMGGAHFLPHNNSNA